MSVECRQAAQQLLSAGLLRSSVSRAYYAAYCALTAELAGRVTFGGGRPNPTHAQLLIHVRHNLKLPVGNRRNLSRAVRMLWKARVAADYMPSVSIERATALGALRMASVIARELETHQ
jgi:uncharacterized protein (UPF0332 family)